MRGDRLCLQGWELKDDEEDDDEEPRRKGRGGAYENPAATTYSAPGLINRVPGETHKPPAHVACDQDELRWRDGNVSCLVGSPNHNCGMPRMLVVKWQRERKGRFQRMHLNLRAENLAHSTAQSNHLRT